MEAEASTSDSTLADLGLRSSPFGYLIAVGQVRLSPQDRHNSEPEVPRPCRGWHARRSRWNSRA